MMTTRQVIGLMFVAAALSGNVVDRQPGVLAVSAVGSDTRAPARVAPTIAWRSGPVAANRNVSVQALDCNDSWDCGSAPACDPHTECSVDLYACVISQQTGRGQCVWRGTCDTCQPFQGDPR